MCLALFFLLLSHGVSSSFLPLKEIPPLQKKTRITVIDEMLCLLKADNEHINVPLSRPVHIKEKGCAHNNTEKFISELEKLHTCTCLRIVEQDMKMLERNCSFLQKHSHTKQNCSSMVDTNFSRFKEYLEHFLKWINTQGCNNILRSELDLSPAGNCSCHQPWEHHRGRF